MSIHAVDKIEWFFWCGTRAKIDYLSCHLRVLDRVRKVAAF